MNDHKSNPVLEIEDLTVAYRQGKSWLEAVHHLCLSIEAGQMYGLVGESGSGKSTLVLAVMRYLGENGAVRGGRIKLLGQDLVALDREQLRQVWGRQITMVPQNPSASLNPSLRVGEQLAETLRNQGDLSDNEVRLRVIDLLERVHIADPHRVASSYPHQLSGGMQQRVLIAMAVSTEPELLILDEPTTNLDVTTQAVILELVGELVQERKSDRMAVLYVTHNLGVVAQICDQVGVMYAGELVEEAPVQDLFQNPIHPYTQGLLNSTPGLGQSKYSLPLQSIPGQIPPLGERTSGCVFAPRCPLAIEICKQRPPLTTVGSDQQVRCHRWEEIANREVQAWDDSIGIGPVVRAKISEGAEVLALEEVAVHFPIRRSLSEVARRETPQAIQAVGGVSLKIKQGETLGLVGESGSGKTTLARAVVGLVQKSGGSIDLLTVELPGRLSQRDVSTLRHLQMVFQNPDEALNPHLTVGESLRRPFITLLGRSPQQADREVNALLQAVRLPPSYARRLPGQLSGGEKQRVAIARAFAANPDLLIADEPVSSLDVSVQAAVLNLLNDLQSEHGTSLIFISHNLAVVGYLADKIAVMYLGNLVEVSDSASLFEPPFHPYTEALLSAIPSGAPDVQAKPIHLEGEIPSPADIPAGCPFHTRCPRYLGQVCVVEPPPWQTDDLSGKRYSCHIPPNKLLEMQSRIKER
jgi:peptide/nickel transport system ATP-binding protein